MASNADFEAVLTQMQRVHDAKNEDYAEGANPYSNFEGVARIVGVPVDQVFQTMIGIKMERLRQLVGTDKEPNFESIDDTILDLANYSAIWLSWRRRQAFDAGPGAIISRQSNRLPTIIAPHGELPKHDPADPLRNYPTARTRHDDPQGSGGPR